jgi:hypothetical protein
MEYVVTLMKIGARGNTGDAFTGEIIFWLCRCGRRHEPKQTEVRVEEETEEPFQK